MIWQPVEAIPENTPILITNGDIVVSAQIKDLGVYNFIDVEGVYGYEWECTLDFNDITGWMPRPELPNSQNQSPHNSA